MFEGLSDVLPRYLEGCVSAGRLRLTGRRPDDIVKVLTVQTLKVQDCTYRKVPPCTLTLL